MSHYSCPLSEAVPRAKASSAPLMDHPRAPPQLLDLPREILVYCILRRLPMRALSRFSRVSRTCRALAADDLVWATLFVKHFAHVLKKQRGRLRQRIGDLGSLHLADFGRPPPPWSTWRDAFVACHRERLIGLAQSDNEQIIASQSPSSTTTTGKTRAYCSPPPSYLSWTQMLRAREERARRVGVTLCCLQCFDECSLLYFISLAIACASIIIPLPLGLGSFDSALLALAACSAAVSSAAVLPGSYLELCLTLLRALCAIGRVWLRESDSRGIFALSLVFECAPRAACQSVSRRKAVELLAWLVAQLPGIIALLLLAGQLSSGARSQKLAVSSHLETPAERSALLSARSGVVLTDCGHARGIE